TVGSGSGVADNAEQFVVYVGLQGVMHMKSMLFGRLSTSIYRLLQQSGIVKIKRGLLFLKTCYSGCVKHSIKVIKTSAEVIAGLHFYMPYPAKWKCCSGFPRRRSSGWGGVSARPVPGPPYQLWKQQTRPPRRRWFGPGQR